MKKILITSGGTREYLDDVRVLTNISTGKLGAMIAEKFIHQNKFERHKEHQLNYEVHYVAPKSAVAPQRFGGFLHKDEIHFHEVTNVQSVYDTVKFLAPGMDAVIHSMAVSDFMFKPARVKLKSNDPLAFIESLRLRIEMAPKILPIIKQWNSNCKLVSFKFEVDIPHQQLVEIARKSMESGNSDLVIANDKQEMAENQAHIAYAIFNGGEEKLFSKTEIANYVFNFIESQL